MFNEVEWRLDLALRRLFCFVCRVSDSLQVLWILEQEDGHRCNDDGQKRDADQHAYQDRIVLFVLGHIGAALPRTKLDLLSAHLRIQLGHHRIIVAQLIDLGALERASRSL